MWRPDFLFGAATAAYQIEGGVAEDGRHPSIWDTFSATPGKVLNGDTGVVACDHYHRWEEDLRHVEQLGLGAYRLSVSWSRVMDEAGAPNPRGLDFYKRLLDRLQERGLQSFVTLYHWDLPQCLQDRGGWLNRDTAGRFADYAALLARELRGRVSAWTTLNEPWCSAYLGHANGQHAPGLKRVRYAVEAMHHLLLGHGIATRVLRDLDKAPVGIVSNVNAVQPDSERPEDLQAARMAFACANSWVLDPVLLGRYPEALRELWPGIEPPLRDRDMDLIRTPLDYLGINYYFRATVRSDGAHGYLDRMRPGVERTQMGWEVYPEGLRDLLLGFKARYPRLPPIYITENGMASDDRVLDGRVDDAHRISYLGRHLAAVDEAMRGGVDVRGYFFWSLLDNFEWAYGYERRFGLIHVDYATQQRTLKDSALAVRDFLRRRREAAR
ncbi:GH1 family beta-glucosidase [Aquabacterium sp. A7-Y]|uniref:GH1 family beta-glucosidase n=1 Tax=Aquabacterium sp. A7-Y TaxID=1349605 RepID=UPI00223CB65B|nr:GH1 family beta-glucosidase [Aquabacterium sp. A7-Y]MCW7537921.1 GH1 family beta-glucosidase [Aquabacterium sp. A7-Y]